MITVYRMIIEGLLSVLVTLAFSIIFGAIICFLWPVINTIFPGLDGLVASEIYYIDAVAFCFLLSTIISSAR